MKHTPDQVKVFAEDLRRAIYMGRIAKYVFGALKSNPATPYAMKDDCKAVENAINRFISNGMVRASPAVWEQVKQDMNRDELHDISLLLDSVCDVTNVADITAVINQEKKFAA